MATSVYRFLAIFLFLFLVFFLLLLLVTFLVTCSSIILCFHKKSNVLEQSFFLFIPQCRRSDSCLRSAVSLKAARRKCPSDQKIMMLSRFGMDSSSFVCSSSNSFFSQTPTESIRTSGEVPGKPAVPHVDGRFLHQKDQFA